LRVAACLPGEKTSCFLKRDAKDRDRSRSTFAFFAKAMLLFKKKFLDAIRAGDKTQTIRLWTHRRMRAGQRSYIPGVGAIRITAVDQVELDQLTDADAKPDGFETADALRAELAQLYAKQLESGYRAFRVVFEIVPPEVVKNETRRGTIKKYQKSKEDAP
jgi:hypothetical protein